MDRSLSVNRPLMHALVALRLVTLKIIAAIHREALQL
jgi:hypothetical protein